MKRSSPRQGLCYLIACLSPARAVDISLILLRRLSCLLFATAVWHCAVHCQHMCCHFGFWLFHDMKAERTTKAVQDLNNIPVSCQVHPAHSKAQICRPDFLGILCDFSCSSAIELQLSLYFMEVVLCRRFLVVARYVRSQDKWWQMFMISIAKNNTLMSSQS